MIAAIMPNRSRFRSDVRPGRSLTPHHGCPCYGVKLSLLVEQGGGTITQITAFPIASDATKFNAGVKAKL